MTDKGLGRRIPTDWEHIEKYPLTASTIPAAPTPVAIGINWYSNFDNPVKIGQRYWIGKGNLGSIRGGHCICIKPVSVIDASTWYGYYDQGSEGACVGFGCSRMMSLLNRHRYDALWLYREAQKIDEWPGEDYDGTSVRAGCEMLRTRGHKVVYRTTTYPESTDQGISTYRWASSVDATLDVLGEEGRATYYERVGAVPLLNSWGKSYPHTVWLPLETLERLIDEDGEVALVTDR